MLICFKIMLSLFIGGPGLLVIQHHLVHSICPQPGLRMPLGGRGVACGSLNSICPLYPPRPSTLAVKFEPARRPHGVTVCRMGTPG